MVVLRKVVLDVLKPQSPSILELSKKLGNLKGVDDCSIDINEVERHVETVKITLKGPQVKMEEIEKVIKENGATIHNIDQVSTAKKGK